MQWWNKSLEDLEKRVDQLDEWARAQDDPALSPEEKQRLFSVVFPGGSVPEDPWDDYHRVRSEYDRLAAEEHDLGQ